MKTETIELVSIAHNALMLERATMLLRLYQKMLSRAENFDDNQHSFSFGSRSIVNYWSNRADTCRMGAMRLKRMYNHTIAEIIL